MTGTAEDTFAVETLRRCALFARFNDDALAACAGSLRVRRFRKNETIFHQGDPGDSLFIIESGAVKIVLPSPEGEEGAIIATLGRGDFFGELALLDGAPHSATAVALESAEMLVMRREPFEQLIDTDRDLRMALFAGLTAELRRLTGPPGRRGEAAGERRGRPRLAVHPVGARLDDRRHAADGEPAPVRHGDRRAHPLREGHRRHPRSRAPRPRGRPIGVEGR